MRARPVVVGTALLAFALVSAAPAQNPSTLARATMKNDVGIELLGKALLYSFNYQRMMGSSLGLEVGLGALGGGGSASDATVLFVPAGVKFYVIPKDGSIYLTGGGVFVTGFVDSGPFTDGASDAYGYAGLGFEFRSPGGFLFRGTAYSLIGGGGWFIWPALSVGYAF